MIFKAEKSLWGQMFVITTTLLKLLKAVNKMRLQNLSVTEFFPVAVFLAENTSLKRARLGFSLH